MREQMGHLVDEINGLREHAQRLEKELKELREERDHWKRIARVKTDPVLMREPPPFAPRFVNESLPQDSL
jgi:hypothetical protein